MSDLGEQAQAERGSHAPRAEEEAPRRDPRRTGRLAPTDNDWSNQEPVNPGWRQGRASTRSSRRARGGMPASPQELQIWLQQGGWRYLAIIAAAFVVALIVLLWLNQSSRSTVTRSTTSATATALAAQAAVIPQLATVTAAPATQAPPQAQAFVVEGTAGEGLFLRNAPTSQSDPLETLPDGTRVESLGDETSGPGQDGQPLTWRKVRAPSGQEGWVAASFLQAAP